MTPARRSQENPRGAHWRPATLIGLALLVGLSVVARRVNHDESQYVAAIALMRFGLPYRDFAYLQTPLLPLLLSPLSILPAGWTFLAARAASGAFGYLTLLFLWWTLDNRVSSGARFVALFSLACTNAFLLASSLARNDALPMLLIAAALLPLLRAIALDSRPHFALGGLLLGLAVSAKISAALPAAGAGLFILLRCRRGGIQPFFSFAIGLVAGLLPTLIAAAIAPSAFGFDVLGYNLRAPVQWWSSIGQAHELTPLVRLSKLIAMAALGPVLVALLAAAFDRRRKEELRLLDLMIIGGIISAFLPVPALTQYLVPLLPPLFVRFGLALDDAPKGRRRSLLALAAASSVAGLAASVVASSAELEIVRHLRLGREVAALANGASVVTLSPEYVAGGSVKLDPRFAAGPFLYRTRGKLALTAERDGRGLSVDRLDPSLDLSRPAVILVGGEREPFPPTYPNGLDQPLVDWSVRSGYEPRPLGAGFVAFVAPGRAVRGRPSG